MKQTINKTELVMKILHALLIIFVVIGTYKIVVVINQGRMFKPDFKFEYWINYKNPTCTFNNPSEIYEDMCSRLIAEVEG